MFKPQLLDNPVFVGSMLGDGYLSSLSRRVMYEETKKVLHRRYLQWKSNNFLFRSKIKRLHKHDTRPNCRSSYYVYRLRSFSEDSLTEIYPFFYQDKKRIIHDVVLQQLTPLALAVWYCDDGFYSYPCHRAYISINRYSSKDRQKVRDFFQSKGFSCSLSKQASSETLAFTVDGTFKFIELIKPVFPRDVGMEYKLGRYHPSNSLRCKKEKIKKVNCDSKSYYKRHDKALAQKMEYNHRPYVIERKKKWDKLYREKNREKLRLRCKERYNSFKARQQRKTPEFKERAKLAEQRYRERKKKEVKPHVGE
jgi:hypothetical protein